MDLCAAAGGCGGFCFGIVDLDHFLVFHTG